ncbi:MAG: histidine phosphatase family protein [Clostridia bacterium]|nr:histidine phosphatase family protein [Clostridia bacterium]
MLLYVIRHADPTYSPDALTPKGRRQAEALGKRLALHGLDKIYSSPLIRAQQTAQPACEMLGKEKEILDWASEGLASEYFGFLDDTREGRWCWSFGINPTRYYTEENLKLGDKWYEGYPFCHTKAKEGYELIAQKSDEFLESLGYKREGLKYKILNHTDERVAVFCHYGFGMVWLSHLLQINPISFWSHFGLNHSGMTVIGFSQQEDGYTTPRVVTLSDTSHIYAEGLPTQFTNEFYF